MAENLLDQPGVQETRQQASQALTAVEDAYISALGHLRMTSAHSQAGASEVPGPFSAELATNRTEDSVRLLSAASYLPRLSEVTPSGLPKPLRTRVLRRWTGVVEDIVDDVFTGRLTQSDNGAEDLLAEFAIDEVSEDDLPLLKPGAWFYVNIAKQSFADGRQSTISSLRFRRLSRWTEEELAIAQERAEKIAGLLSEE